MMDRRGRLFFCFNFAKEVHAREEFYRCSELHSKVLGVDLGVNKLATTSDSRFFVTFPGGDFCPPRIRTLTTLVLK